MGIQAIRGEPAKVVRVSGRLQRLLVTTAEERASRRRRTLGDLHEWLLTEALEDKPIGEIVGGLARRLVACGVPLERLSIGGVVLHPSLAAFDTIWEADTDHVRSEQHPRSAVMTPEFRNSPFFMMATKKLRYRRFRLDRDPTACAFPLLDRLRSAGVNDYVTFFHAYGVTEEKLCAELEPGTRGANMSFATRRAGGFTDPEIEQLRDLSKPLSMVVKSATSFELSRALLDTYLGRRSGEQVLRGRLERGDSRQIDCVLWYCDLRSSTRFAESLTLEDYFATLNQYLEAAAGSVLDHGGEVLKYIGDAVMAIFPIDDDARSRSGMCRAALMAAADAQARLASMNAAREDAGQPPVEMGVALHVGRVLYGNVGTLSRLDFTVIGPAVNEAVRLEKLCKALGCPIVVSGPFKEICEHGFVPLGRHSAPGVSAGLEAFAPAAAIALSRST